jgi:hypothetical protein
MGHGEYPPQKNELHVRAQDRDELARIFTAANARRNGLGPEILHASTEPLLAGKPLGSEGWDLIISNIPAKTGLPVLEDFVRRSATLLNPGGRVIIVAVNTLALFFEAKIQASASLLRKEQAAGHTVFVYGEDADQQNERTLKAAFPSPTVENLLMNNPAYIRNRGDYAMEKTSYHLDTIHGAEGFDHPAGEVLAAAKLAVKREEDIRSCLRSDDAAVLIWEGDQGHFSTWLVKRFGGAFCTVLSGRNILALAAARFNTARAMGGTPDGADVPHIVCAADLFLDGDRILAEINGGSAPEKKFAFVAAFPEAVPQTDRISPFWDALDRLAAPGAVVIVGLSSAGAERFDRKKPKDFSRLGDLRRNGFRALAYRKKIL